MTKYLYAECTQDYWPEIRVIYAPSYNDAVEKLIQNYGMQYDDDELLELSNFDELQNYLNDNYTIAISNLEDIEEL